MCPSTSAVSGIPPETPAAASQTRTPHSARASARRARGCTRSAAHARAHHARTPRCSCAWSQNGTVALGGAWGRGPRESSWLKLTVHVTGQPAPFLTQTLARPLMYKLPYIDIHRLFERGLDEIRGPGSVTPGSVN
jgi:hypothetical protein